MKMRRLFTILIFFMLLLAAAGAACSLTAPASPPPGATAPAGEGDGETPTPAAGLASLPEDAPPPTPPVEGQPAEIDPQDLSPAGFLDALLEKVEAGEWSYEEGLVFTLKVLAGETQAAAEYPKQPASGEGTGVIAEGQRYLRQGSDPDVKTEISRLLGIIAPAPENLAGYARPAQESRAKPAGLGAPNEVNAACSDLWADGFPPSQTILVCLEYLSVYFGGTNAVVYYPIDPQPAGFTQEYAVNALQAIGDSVETYAKYGVLKDVQLVFTILGDPDSATTLAMVPTVGGAQTCQIIVYPKSIAADKSFQNYGYAPFAHFRQTIAHEMFHCFQVWNFPKLSDSDWAVQDWWGEGTADYFSNVVYPHTNLEWLMLPVFDIRSANKSIIDLSYENSVFFQYLANRIGNEDIIAFINTLPESGGAQAQTKALAALPGIQEMFHDFGQDFMDGMIVDASKAMVPSGPPFIPPGFKVNVATPHDISVFKGKPFSLPRYELNYQPEKLYSQSNSSGGPDGLHATRQTLAPGAWGPFPEVLPAGCGGPVYYVMLTSATESADNHEVTLTTEVEQELDCDECLVGTWDLDKPSFVEYMYSAMSYSDIFSVEMVSGLWRWSFSKDGIFKAQYGNFNLDYAITQTGIGTIVRTDIKLVMNGAGTAMYWTEGEGSLVANMLNHNFSIEQYAWMNGDPIDHSEFGDLFTPGPASSHQYACSATQLSVVVTAAPQLSPLLFNKVSNSPLP